MKTNVRNSSLDAYFYIRGNGTVLNQKGRIIEDLVKARTSLTRVEISKRTGITINAVSGRVNELIRDGYLHESSQKRKCHFTGMYVYPLKPTEKV